MLPTGVGYSYSVLASSLEAGWEEGCDGLGESKDDASMETISCGFYCLVGVVGSGDLGSGFGGSSWSKEKYSWGVEDTTVNAFFSSWSSLLSTWILIWSRSTVYPSSWFSTATDYCTDLVCSEATSTVAATLMNPLAAELLVVTWSS